MSIHAISWVLKNSTSELADRLVLIVLADHAGDGFGNAHPSSATIARDANLSERQVSRSLANLQSNGLIVQTGTTTGRVRVWRIVTDPDEVAKLAGSQIGGDKVAKLASKGSQIGGDKVAKLATSHIIRTEPSLLTVIEPLSTAIGFTVEPRIWENDPDLFAILDGDDFERAAIVFVLAHTSRFRVCGNWPSIGFDRVANIARTLPPEIFTRELGALYWQYAKSPFSPTAIPVNAATSWFRRAADTYEKSIRSASKPSSAKPVAAVSSNIQTARDLASGALGDNRS